MRRVDEGNHREKLGDPGLFYGGELKRERAPSLMPFSKSSFFGLSCAPVPLSSSFQSPDFHRTGL